MALSSTRWWHEVRKGDAGLATAVTETESALRHEQERRNNDYRRWASLYKDRSIIGFDPGNWRSSWDDVLDRPVSYNAVRSVVDALTAKITARQPEPKFLTSGGSEDLQEKAKLQEKMIKGIFDAADVSRKAEQAFRDACIYGLGLLKVSPGKDGIRIDCVHPSRVTVDSHSALTTPPLTMFQKEWMDPSALLEMFPGKEAVVEAAPTKSLGSGGSAVRELVEVREAWRLPVGGKKGRHVICTDNGVLLDEEWESEEFPFAVIRYSRDLMGWHGSGLAEQLEGIQLEIDDTISKIQRNMHMMAVPFILKPKGGEILDEHLGTNEEFRIIEYVGEPPTYQAPPAVNPQVFQHLDALWNKAYEISGLSQLSATSQKPPGLNSGVALRTYHDIETVRFSQIAKEWERLFVDLSRKCVEAARILATQEGGFEVRVPSDRIIEVVGLDADMLGHPEIRVVEVYPASALPSSPAGRLERVTEMAQAQLISPEEARALLDFPDLEKHNRLANAAYEDLEAMFEHFIGKDGEYIEPLPWQDLRTGIRLGTSYWLRGRMDKVPKQRLDRVARWLADAADMLEPPPPPQAEAPPAAPPPMPPGQMGGVPVPPGAPPGAEAQPTPEDIAKAMADLQQQPGGVPPVPPAGA